MILMSFLLGFLVIFLNMFLEMGLKKIVIIIFDAPNLMDDSSSLRFDMIASFIPARLILVNTWLILLLEIYGSFLLIALTISAK